jgi:hypothetical protein
MSSTTNALHVLDGAGRARLHRPFTAEEAKA